MTHKGKLLILFGQDRLAVEAILDSYSSDYDATSLVSLILKLSKELVEQDD